MILLTILLLPTIILAILFAKMMYFDEVWEAISGGFMGAILGFILGLFSLLIVANIVDSKANKTQVIDYVEEIQALQDNVGIKGNFYLGYGQVSDKLKYYYIVRDNNNIKIKSIENSESLVIEENNNIKPQIIHYKYRFTNELAQKNFRANGEATKIIIPANSIKYDFSVDLK